jgi:hypothetical protein
MDTSITKTESKIIIKDGVAKYGVAGRVYTDVEYKAIISENTHSHQSYEQAIKMIEFMNSIKKN